MKKWNLWIASFLVVVVVYQFCYGLETLLPGNVSWLMTAKHDWGTHYLGWMFFKEEVWHFPFGDVHNYFYPVGTNVGFTDSIPLFAIFFKLFSPILPSDFQYFGIWLFLCHLLATFYTIKLSRLFKINDLFTFIAVIFIAANPVLIYRGLHPALCAHWLLIACIYLYCLDPSVVNNRKILRYQFIILMIAALVNPYLCLMVLGFSFALAVKLFFYKKAIGKRQFISYLAISIVSLVVSGFIIGIFRFGEGENVGVQGGYGLYGWNLHSLYNSFGFSSFLPGLKQVDPHQYEGYSYLGLGMFFLILFLFVYAIVSRFIAKDSSENKKSKNFLLNNSRLPVYVLVILLTLFSISHVVTLDERILFKLPIPNFLIRIGDVFRASARFFWPVYYLIFLFTIIMIAKARMGIAFKAAILSVAVLLQLYDTKLLFTFRNLSYGSYHPPIDEKNWNSLLGSFDNIVMVPPFETTSLDHMDYQYFCWLAGKAGKPITTGYVARVDNSAVRNYIDSLESQLEEGRLLPGTLYITTAAHLKKFSLPLMTDSGRINYLDGYYYIYSSKKEDSALTSLSATLNKPFMSKLDSAIASLGERKQFKVFNDQGLLKPGAIKYNLEEVKDKGSWLSAFGWAFVDGVTDSKNDSVFFALRNDTAQYIVAADIFLRPDVTAHFNAKHLDNTGFDGHFFTKDVARGVYTLCIVIKNANGQYIYTPTDKTIRVRISEFAVPEKVTTLPMGIDISFNVEDLKTDEKQVYMQGWAFIKNQEATGKISIVLTRENEIYVAETEPMLRPDVTAHIKNGLNLDNSGFVVKILKNVLSKGKYKLGIYIKDNSGKKEGAVFTGREIEF